MNPNTSPRSTPCSLLLELAACARIQGLDRTVEWNPRGKFVPTRRLGVPVVASGCMVVRCMMCRG